MNRYANMPFWGYDRRSRLTPIRWSVQLLFRLFGRARRGILGVDKIGKIGRTNYREGCSIKGTSRDLGVSRCGPEGFAFGCDGVRLQMPDAAAFDDRSWAVGTGGDAVKERVPSEARANGRSSTLVRDQRRN